jgi:hypothetical protein
VTADTTFHSNVQKKVKDVTRGNCCGACDNVTACEAWTWESRSRNDTSATGECRLVWPLGGQAPRKDSGWSSAVHRGPAPSPP